MEYMNLTGAAITLALGALGLFSPQRAAAFTSIAPVGPLGLSEIRATYGGFFLALGGMCLYCQNPIAFRVVGVAWLGAALGRAYSLVIDRNTEPKNLVGIAFESAIAALLLL